MDKELQIEQNKNLKYEIEILKHEIEVLKKYYKKEVETNRLLADLVRNQDRMLQEKLWELRTLKAELSFWKFGIKGN